MRTTRHIVARAALAVVIASGGVAALAVPQAAVFAAAPPSPTTPLKLKSLSIVGNQQVATADILAAVPFHEGDTVTRNQIDAGAQDVMAVYQKKNVGLKFGEKLKFLGNAVQVQWVIEEQAPQAAAPAAALVVDKVVFQGNKAISAADLTAATKLRPGAPVDEAAVIADQKAVQALYQKKNVGVAIQVVPTQPNNDNHVVLTYQITEKSSD